MGKKITKLPKRKPIRFTCTVKLEGHEKSPTAFTLTAGKFKNREDALKYFSAIWNAIETAREQINRKISVDKLAEKRAESLSGN